MEEEKGDTNLKPSMKGWAVLKKLLAKGQFAKRVRLSRLHAMMDGIATIWNQGTNFEYSLMEEYFSSTASISNHNIDSHLTEIAEGLAGEFEYEHETAFQRGWMVMIVSLLQPDPSSRYIALKNLRRALVNVSDTLRDVTLIKYLENNLLAIMVSDEYLQNRILSIWLLGLLLSKLLITSGPHVDHSIHTFFDVLRRLISLKLESNDIQRQHVLEVAYLYDTLGKFLVRDTEQFAFKPAILFLLSKEFSSGEVKGNTVLLTILKLLNFQIPKNPQTLSIIGPMFSKHIKALMKTDNERIKMEAVRFIGSWLPALAGNVAEELINGVEKIRTLFPNIEDLYEEDLRELRRMARKDLKRMNRLSKILRRLKAVPGTFATFTCDPEDPGYFISHNCSMMHSTDIVLELGAPPESVIVISRDIPHIKGVPESCTTIPPLVLGENADIEGRNMFNLDARILSLPGGYTASLNDEVLSEAPPGGSITQVIPDDEDSTLPGFIFKSPFDDLEIQPVDEKFITDTVGIQDQESSSRKTGVQRARSEKIYTPTGYSGHGEPIVCDKDLKHLSEPETSADFHKNSKIMFEIEVPNHKLIKATGIVSEVGKDLAAIAVASNDDSNENVFIQKGQTVNLTVRHRTTGDWIPITIEILTVEEDQPTLHLIKHIEEQTTKLISAGYSNAMNSEYFYPPVNIPPLPDGYVDLEHPYYGRPKPLQQVPMGYLSSGKPFYSISSEGTNPNQQDLVAGYTNDGIPFFLPPHCKTIIPCGFTQEGIPFYNLYDLKLIDMILKKKVKIPAEVDKKVIDVQSAPGDTGEALENIVNEYMNLLVRQVADHGQDEFMKELEVEMAGLPVEQKLQLLAQRAQSLGEIGNAEGDKGIEHTSQVSRHRQKLQQKLAGDLTSAHSQMLQIIDKKSPLEEGLEAIEEKYVQKIEKTLGEHTKEGVSMEGVSMEGVSMPSSGTVIDDDKALERLMEGTQIPEVAEDISWAMEQEESEFSKRGLEASFFPEEIQFQGTEEDDFQDVTIVYSFDDEEREFFVVIKPTEIFVPEVYSVKLKGKMNFNVKIKFRPQACEVPSSSVTGKMGLVDASGKGICSCKLVGFCGPVLSLSRADFDFTWKLPGTELSLQTTVKNIGIKPIIVKLKLDDLEYEEAAQFPYSLGSESLQITPGNEETFTITFKPKEIGYCRSRAVLNTPIENHSLDILGVCGDPITLIPGQYSMKELRAVLLEDVGELPKRIGQTDASALILHALNMGGKTKFGDILDVRFIDPRKEKILLFFSVLSLSSEKQPLGIFSSSPAVEVESSILANAVDVVKIPLHLIPSKLQEGAFEIRLNVMSAAYGNQSITIVGHCGYPAISFVREFSFFKTLQVQKKAEIELEMQNQSSYTIKYTCHPFNYFAIKDGTVTREARAFSVVSPDSSLTLAPFSSGTLTLEFSPRSRGPHISEFLLGGEGLDPWPINPFYSRCFLIGICIEPISDGNESLNNITLLEKWLMTKKSHIIQDQPSPDTLGSLFDMSKLTEKKYAENFTLDLNSISLSIPFQDLNEDEQKSDQIDLKNENEDEDEDEQDMILRGAVVSTLHASGQFSIKSSVGKKQTLTFLTSFLLYPVPLTLELFPHSNANAEVVYKISKEDPREFVNYGFLTAISHPDEIAKSISIIGRYGPSLYLVQKGTIDFGSVSEFSTNQLVEKKLTIRNTSTSEMEWLMNVELISKKSGFKFSESHGMIGKGAWKIVTVTYTGSTAKGKSHVEVSLLGRDPLSAKSDYTHFQTVQLIAYCETELIIGIPTEISFGNALLNTKREAKFVISSMGSMKTKISFHAKLPFHVNKQDVYLANDEKETIVISFFPYSTTFIVDEISVFINEKVKTIKVSGNAGLMSLANLRAGQENVIDFGYVRKNMISWSDVFLLNRGTLPLQLRRIEVSERDVACVEFIGYQKEINKFPEWSEEPKGLIDDMIHCVSEGTSPIHFTGISATSKLSRVFFPLQMPDDEMSMLIEDEMDGAHRPDSKKNRDTVDRLNSDINDPSSLSKVNKTGSAKSEKGPLAFSTSDFEVPILMSGVCYHLRIGFHPQSTHVTKAGMTFFYSASSTTTKELPKNAKIRPPGIYFPGGSDVVEECASADLVFSPGNYEVDFGTAALNSSIIRQVLIRNTGLLGGSYSLQIVANGEFYVFTEESTDTINGFIESGESVTHSIKVTAYLTEEINIVGNMIFRFQPVPHGNWTAREIRMRCGIGKPDFKIIRNSVADFGTVFIGLPKSVDIVIRNDGNAQSQWRIESDCDLVKFDSTEGILMPGRQQKIFVTYEPANFDPLDSKFVFKTDLLDLTVPLKAITGIPFLKIPHSQLVCDLGVLEAEVVKHHFVEVKNTARSPMEIEVTLTEYQGHESNTCLTGLPDPMSYFKVLTPKLILPPNVTRQLDISVTPLFEKELKVGFCVQSSSGERYDGTLRCIGGLAIMHFHKYDVHRLLPEPTEIALESVEGQDDKNISSGNISGSAKNDTGASDLEELKDKSNQESVGNSLFDLANFTEEDFCYDVGLVKGGVEDNDFIPCFILTNMGNVPFPYEIISLTQQEESLKKAEFIIEQKTGICEPQKQSILKCRFVSSNPGFYTEDFRVQGSKKTFDCSITINIGIGQLEVKTMAETKDINFGTIVTETQEVQTLSIMNIGTYPVRVDCQLNELKIKANDEQDMVVKDLKTMRASQKPFLVQQPFSEIKAQIDMLVQITFMPKEESSYEQALEIKNDCGQELSMKLLGSGGSEKLALKWDDEKDQVEPFMLADFGVCHTEMTLAKTLKLKNVGLVTVDFNISINNDLFKFDKNPESSTLKPGKMKSFVITFRPEKEGVVEDAELTILSKCRTYTIPLKAEASVFSLSVIQQSMDFKQMMIKSEQTKHFEIKNTSRLPMGIRVDTMLGETQKHTMDVQFLDSNIQLETLARSSAQLKSIANLKSKEEVEKDQIKSELDIPGADLVLQPGETRIVTVTVKPDAPENIDTTMKIIPVAPSADLRQMISKEVEQTDIPVQVEVFESELTLAGYEELADLGQTAPFGQLSRKLSFKNETKEERDFKVEITDIPELANDENSGIGSGSSGKLWTASPDSGQLQPHGGVDVELLFNAGEAEMRNEVNVTIKSKKAVEKDGWKEAMQFNACATVASPVIEVSTTRLDYGNCSSKIPRIEAIEVKNIGSGNLEGSFYLAASVSNVEATNKDFSYVKDFKANVLSLKAGEKETFEIKFSPSTLFEKSDAYFIVNTNGGDKVVALSGMGAEFAIANEALPDQLFFGEIHFGDSSEQSFCVTNKSKARTRLVCAVVPENEDNPIYGNYHIEPTAPILEPTDEDSIGVIDIVVQYSTQAPPRFSSKDELLDLAHLGEHTHTLTISLPNGTSCSFPVSHQITLRPLNFGLTDEAGYFTPQSSIFCGAIPIESKTTISFAMENRNQFEVPFELVIPEEIKSSVSLDVCEGVVDRNSVLTIPLIVSPLDNEHPGNTFSLVLESLFNCVPVQTIPFTLTTLAKSAEKIILEDVKFEEQVVNGHTPLSMSIPAFVSKPTPYKILIDNEAFQVAPELMFGELEPGQPLNIPVEFFPKELRRYTGVASIVTDEGVFEMKLEGIGVHPSIEISPQNIDFGAVGLNERKSIKVEISNTGEYDLKLIVRSDHESFSGDAQESKDIGKGETRAFTLWFSPVDKGARTSVIKFFCDMRKGDDEDETDENVIFLGGINAVGSVGESELLASVTTGSVLHLHDENQAEALDQILPGNENITMHQKSVKKARGKRYSIVQFKNTGDTEISLLAVDENGYAVEETGDFSSNSHHNVMPRRITLIPGETTEFTITSDIKEGSEDEDFDFGIKVEGKEEIFKYHVDARNAIEDTTVLEVEDEEKDDESTKEESSETIDSSASIPGRKSRPLKPRRSVSIPEGKDITRQSTQETMVALKEEDLKEPVEPLHIPGLVADILESPLDVVETQGAKKKPKKKPKEKKQTAPLKGEDGESKSEVQSRDGSAKVASKPSTRASSAISTETVEPEFEPLPDEVNLWKVLQPIVRINPHMQVYYIKDYIEPLKPCMDELQCYELTMRPPALPKDYPVSRKWYQDRQSLF
eukprot:Nk52_evm30s240 gene=Nk52_evmTU30s240